MPTVPTTECHTTFDWEPIDGQLLSFDVSYTAEPYRPAVINADPDDCHPAEGGITDIDATLWRVELYLFGDDEPVLTWQPGEDDPGWPSNVAEVAEERVERECEAQLLQACIDNEAENER